MVQVQLFGIATESQKVLGANSYVCRSYRGKTGTGGPFSLPPILNKINVYRMLGAFLILLGLKKRQNLSTSFFEQKDCLQ